MRRTIISNSKVPRPTQRTISAGCGIILTLLFLCANIGYSQTTSGVMSKSETWKGVVNIVGDVTVVKGATLTIEPGTVVRFSANSDNQNSGREATKCELIIEGTLIADGIASKIIRFTSSQALPKAGDWYGIVIKGSQTKSILNHCTIEYGYDGVFCFTSSPDIINSKIQFNYNNGVSCEAKATPIITSCVISANAYAGIQCRLGSSPQVSRTTLTQNRYGVITYDISAPILGKADRKDIGEIGENRIFDNFESNIYNQSNKQIFAQNNDWGTASIKEIDELNYDDDENRSYGQVVIEPIMSAKAIADRDKKEKESRLAVAQPAPQEPKKTPEIKQVAAVIPPEAEKKAEPPKPEPVKVESKAPVPEPVVEKKAEPKPEKKAEVPKPEPIPEKKVEAPKPEPIVEKKAEPPKPEPKAEPPKTEPIAEKKVEPAPAVQPAPQPTTPTPEPKTEAPQPAQPQPAPVTQPEPTAEAAPVFVPTRNEDELDFKPKILKQVPAVYPELARKADIKGVVMIVATVNTDGNVEATRVLRPIGNKNFDADFNKAAEEAVKQFKFEPGEYRGDKSKYWKVVFVRF
jgi:TonB family protein